MAKPKVNYTEEQTAAIIADYQAGKSVEEIAEAAGRAVRSVRAKLVREGVYEAPVKAPKAKREEGPTKKEMLNALDAKVEAHGLTLNTAGLMQATKESIQSISDMIDSLIISDESLDEPAEAE